MYRIYFSRICSVQSRSCIPVYRTFGCSSHYLLAISFALQFAPNNILRLITYDDANPKKAFIYHQSKLIGGAPIMLRMKSSSIGLFAKRSFEPDEFISEYVGEITTGSKFDNTSAKKLR